MRLQLKALATAMLLALVLHCSQSFALCMPNSALTESDEPVTIKMGDRYFEIPESFFYYNHQRVPMERASLRLDHFKLGENEYSVGMSLGKTDKPSEWSQYIDDDILIRLAGSNDDSVLSKKIIPYLESISSKAPPTTWDDDRDLVKRFGLGKQPCRDWQFFDIFTGFIGRIGDAFYGWRADVLKGLRHRNSGIRRAAALRAQTEGVIDDEVRQVLLHLAKNDKVATSRRASVGALGSIAARNNAVISELREVVEKDADASVRREAVEALIMNDPNFLVFANQLLPSANDGLKDTLKGVFLSFLARDYRQEKNPATFEQLGNHGKLAAKSLMYMLRNNPSEDLRSDIIQVFYCCGTAVATPEYIAYLNEIAMEDKLNLSYVALVGLQKMGVKPDNPDAVLARFASEEDKYKYNSVKKMLEKK